MKRKAEQVRADRGETTRGRGRQYELPQQFALGIEYDDLAGGCRCAVRKSEGRYIDVARLRIDGDPFGRRRSSRKRGERRRRAAYPRLGGKRESEQKQRDQKDTRTFHET